MQIESCYSLLQTTFWLLRALGSGMSHLSCLSSIMSHQRPHCPLGQSTYHHLLVFQTGPTLSPASEPFHIPSCSILLRCIIHPTSHLCRQVSTSTIYQETFILICSTTLHYLHYYSFMLDNNTELQRV